MSGLEKIGLAVLEIIGIAVIFGIVRTRFANPRVLLISLILIFVFIDIIIGYIVR